MYKGQTLDRLDDLQTEWLLSLNLHGSFAEPPEPPLCLDQSHCRGLAVDSLQKTANTAKKVQIAHRRKAGDEPAMSRPNSRIGTLWVKPPTEQAERDPTESGPRLSCQCADE